jgi:CxxC-x17-CxxC domain-containing protein
MEFTDQILKCVDCGEEFVFSAGEQLFFREKGFQHAPKHCKKCKAKHTNTRGQVETSVTCSECGVATTVPFLPHMGRPVLCRLCFQRLRNAGTHTGGLKAALDAPTSQVPADEKPPAK